MKTRCKEGDLAKIVQAIDRRDRGKLVHVLHAVDIQEGGTPRPWWAIQSLSGAVTYEDRDGSRLTGAIGIASIVCIPDEFLDPLPRHNEDDVVPIEIDIVV